MVLSAWSSLRRTQPIAYADELADPEGSDLSFDYSNSSSEGSQFSSATTRSWAGIRFLSQRSTMMMKRVSTQLTEFKDRVRDWRSRSQTLSFCQSYMRVVFSENSKANVGFFWFQIMSKTRKVFWAYHIECWGSNDGAKTVTVGTTVDGAKCSKKCFCVDSFQTHAAALRTKPEIHSVL